MLAALLAASMLVPTAPLAAEELETPCFTEDWTVGGEGASCVDPVAFLHATYDKLVELAGLEPHSVQFVWRPEDYIEDLDVLPGETEAKRKERLGHDGAVVRCGGAPSYGHQVHRHASPGAANICTTDGQDEYAVVAFGPAIFDVAQKCVGKDGEVAKEDALRWIAAHEVVHIQKRHAKEDADKYEKRCVAWLQSSKDADQEQVADICVKMPGCLDAMREVERAVDPDAPDTLRLRAELVKALCKVRFNEDIASDERKRETEADDGASALMEKWKEEDPSIDLRGGQCALTRLRTLEEMGWLGPPPKVKALMHHPGTQDRIDRRKTR